MKSVTFPNGPIKMTDNLHLPNDFSKDHSYVAVVCVHPAGGVNEQTAGLYAARLADEGMVALAYDASSQDESGGEPRQEVDPYARVEDIRAAVDYVGLPNGRSRKMRKHALGRTNPQSEGQCPGGDKLGVNSN